MIQFIKGEPKCRWNGILMTAENYEKLFGINEDNEPIIEDDLIDTGDVLYTDLCFGDLFIRMISYIGEHRGKEPEYDVILSKGVGFNQHCEREAVQCSYIIKEDRLKFFEGVIVKPYKAFKKDYPKFNKEKFLAFQDELNDYYDNKRYLDEPELSK